MTKTTIFYIHGYGSSSSGDSAELMRSAAKQYDFNYFAYDYEIDDKTDPSYILYDIFDTRKLIRGKVIFVGSSLGGFFANHAARLCGDPVVLINPSMFPSVSLKKYGVYDDVLMRFDQMQHAHTTKKVMRIVFCGNNDTVIDPDTNGRMLVGEIINIDMGHRLESKYADLVMTKLIEIENTILDTETDHK